MALKITDIPTTAAFLLLLVLIGAWLNHRFAVAREKRKTDPLSREEREVLVAAAKTGRILLLRTDAYGEWVRAGEIDFFQKDDPAFSARYIEAFHRLRSRGLVMVENGGFRLSGTAFAIAQGSSVT